MHNPSITCFNAIKNALAKTFFKSLNLIPFFAQQQSNNLNLNFDRKKQQNLLSTLNDKLLSKHLLQTKRKKNKILVLLLTLNKPQKKTLITLTKEKTFHIKFDIICQVYSIQLSHKLQLQNDELFAQGCHIKFVPKKKTT